VEYRQLGHTGLFVSSLTLGTMTFGGQGMFGKLGSTDVDGARRQIDMCLDAGINLFDTANMYSGGQSEEILGQAIADKQTIFSWRRRSACRSGTVQTTPVSPATT